MAEFLKETFPFPLGRPCDCVPRVIGLSVLKISLNARSRDVGGPLEWADGGGYVRVCGSAISCYYLQVRDGPRVLKTCVIGVGGKIPVLSYNDNMICSIKIRVSKKGLTGVW